MTDLSVVTSDSSVRAEEVAAEVVHMAPTSLEGSCNLVPTATDEREEKVEP